MSVDLGMLHLRRDSLLRLSLFRLAFLFPSDGSLPSRRLCLPRCDFHLLTSISTIVNFALADIINVIAVSLYRDFILPVGSSSTEKDDFFIAASLYISIRLPYLPIRRLMVSDNRHNIQFKYKKLLRLPDSP